MNLPSATTPPAPARSARTLHVLVFITVMPFVLATLIYYFYKPSGGMSYGQLLETRPVPTFAATDLAGQPSSLARFKGRWLLLMIDDGACDASCLETLFALRQYRLTQGDENLHRIERIWLATGTRSPAAAALARADGTVVLRTAVPIPLPGEQTTGFYLIDPLGNQVMRYPRSADRKKVIAEIGRILKNNDSLG